MLLLTPDSFLFLFRIELLVLAIQQSFVIYMYIIAHFGTLCKLIGRFEVGGMRGELFELLFFKFSYQTI